MRASIATRSACTETRSISAAACAVLMYREITQEQEGQHVIAEVIRIHRPTKLVSDVGAALAAFGLLQVGAH
ncbi:MAG: hypothetical protein MUE46_17995 [Xanthomonadales bacterium]|nr:hypothetical protein [Xanthomonadales bacterium]